MSNDSINGMSYDTIILDEIGDITINLDNMSGSNSTWTSVTSPTISTISTNSINWNDILTTDTFVIGEYKEFVDTMPPMSTVKEMCEIYPGFKKAFDHFKDIYDLVKDDYETRKNSDG